MTDNKPANFEHAYEYLEWIEMNNKNVDWQLVKSTNPAVYTDLMLLRILHISKTKS